MWDKMKNFACLYIICNYQVISTVPVKSMSQLVVSSWILVVSKGRGKGFSVLEYQNSSALPVSINNDHSHWFVLTKPISSIINQIHQPIIPCSLQAVVSSW